VTRRLLLGYLGVTLVVLLLLEVPFGIVYARRERELLAAALERDASVVATIYEDALERGEPLDPGPARRYVQRTSARVVVVDAAGVSLIDSEQGVDRDFSTRPEIAAALEGRRSTGTRPSETLGTDLQYVAVPVASGGTVHGAIRLTLDTADIDAQIRGFWWGLAAIALVVLAAMSLVGWLVARSVTQPLARLNDTARRFGRGDLAVRPDADGGPPELQQLAATMATMAGELATMIDEQRAFVADASHQLRTPLTGLRLRLENLQAGLDPTDADQVDAAIDEIERLSTLVNELLQLARADRSAPVAPHDLATLTAERVDTWSAVAEAADVRLELRVDDDGAGEVAAVPGAIEQILDNLLDNAIGVAPSGSVVAVTVEVAPDGRRLTIADAGPGLSDDDKERALRRFWRGDPGRPGSGLGLPIAAQLAQASGGELTLEDAAGGGLAVVVRLPDWSARTSSG